ncbi:G5 domain-containing protein [Micromonospora sp. WMMD1102]|uniref:G5 domain-containing protein n=1 Tax=Micromonospora sp. WMMD1102 TaxID=3016105 RepID=UPI002414FFFF|nr:G5 domain-containing protein [Micromonospora sp. WMMD1102]MDG4789082.1 G5 domain-containing protein [Micromonospora sp. WMMD1102]
MTYQAQEPSGYRQGPQQPTNRPAVGAPSAGGGRSRAGFLGGLGPGQKAALFVGGPVLSLLLCCGGLAAIGNAADPDGGSPNTSSAAHATPSAAPTSSPPTAASDMPAVPSPVPTSASPTTEKRRVTEVRSIPFGERIVRDSSLAKGKRKVRTAGAKGLKTLTYEVTYVNGVPTSKQLVSEVVTKKPVTRVVAIGTKETRRCDPNYSGCVPIASDVDCAGGSGNGPAYVSGPVRVIGDDIYDLDRDGDGYGCDD